MLGAEHPHEKNDQRLSLETLVSTRPSPQSSGCEPTRSLPASFEAVDIAVLKWIAAEARRMSRR
jgi:hypothetical protein